MTEEIIESIICICEDWKKGQPQTEAARMLAFFHGVLYPGKQFRFCPWCGLPFIEADTAAMRCKVCGTTEHYTDVYGRTMPNPPRA